MSPGPPGESHAGGRVHELRPRRRGNPSGNYWSKDVDDEKQEILWVIKAKTNMHVFITVGKIV
jgi:hypothetical protein